MVTSGKDSTSFGRDDLPLVAKIADQAHTWIFQAPAESSSSGSGRMIPAPNELEPF